MVAKCSRSLQRVPVGSDSKQLEKVSGELEEEFSEQMNSLIEKHHLDWRPQSRHSKLIAHWSRRFWLFLGQFCQIDLYGGLQSSTSSTINRYRWWPYVAFTLYGYTAIRLSIITYWQYIFDFNFLRLQVFKALTTQDNELDVSAQLNANANAPFIRLIRALLDAESNIKGNKEVLLDHSRVDRNQEHAQVLNGGGSQLADLSNELHECVRMARAVLKSVGSPYINLNYVVQVVYECLIVSGFVLVVVIKFYYSRVKPFNFGLTRAFLDHKHERRFENKLVLEQINKFLASSCNFTKACMTQIEWHSAQKLERTRNLTNDEPDSQPLKRLNNRMELNKFLLNHITTKRQLKQMALNGVLLPAHRTAEWVERASILTVFLDLLGVFYATLGTLFFAFVYFALSDTFNIEVAPINILVIIETGIVLSFIIIIGSFFITQTIANCVDQIYFSLNIARQIRQCIRLNRHRLDIILELERNWTLEWPSLAPAICINQVEAQVRQVNLLNYNEFKFDRFGVDKTGREVGMRLMSFTELGSPVESYATIVGAMRHKSWAEVPNERRRSTLDRSLLIRSHQMQMNSDLLKVLMQYKIFVAQIKPLLYSFHTFDSALLLLFVLVPLNLRLHSPYMGKEIKFYSISFNFLCITIVNICYIPLCYMHRRCRDLYDCQSSLLAHVIEVASYSRERAQTQRRKLSDKPATNSNRSSQLKLDDQTQIYESHSIWLLRKELSHPHQLVSQFAIYAFNIRLTYGNMLRLHFWIGLITLSMVVDRSSNHQDFFGRVFSDPLRVFQLHLPGRQFGSGCS